MISPVKIWRNQKKVASLVGKTGRIVSWTIIRVPPSDFTDQAPYPVVLVELEDRSRIQAQLVDWKTEDLTVGCPVVTVIRRMIRPNADGVIPYGIKVKPVIR